MRLINLGKLLIVTLIIKMRIVLIQRITEKCLVIIVRYMQKTAVNFREHLHQIMKMPKKVKFRF